MVTFDWALDKVTGFIVNLKEQYFRNSYANLSEMRQWTKYKWLQDNALKNRLKI